MTARFRTGKRPARHDQRTFLFRSYLDPAAPPAAPESYDAIALATANLGTSVGNLFPTDGNDTLGDCTVAALAHAEALYSALVHQTSILAAGTVEQIYMSLTGGQDTGLDELTVLNWWRQNAPCGAESIVAYASVDPKNHAHVQAAIYLFGAVYLGIQVPANAEADFTAGRTWDVPVTLTNDGHAVLAGAYDQDGLTLLTWGAAQRCTWAWWDACVDECYALLPAQAQTPGFSPAGFDFSQLQADLNEVTR